MRFMEIISNRYHAILKKMLPTSSDITYCKGISYHLIFVTIRFIALLSLSHD